jgi:SNF2 family DNA or RNA helicase
LASGNGSVTLLADHVWQLKYTPEDGDLVKLFYIPALEDAVRYDRLTGYFNSTALTLAARGLEGLIRNSGHMRLIVGCTLNQPEIDAIERGEKLRDMVEQHLAAIPLEAPSHNEHSALELLAWMVASGILDVKVAVPCDDQRRPIPADGIFHEKAGIIEDKCGDRIAWNGSLNETGAGWKYNWESINVYAGWGLEPKRVEEEEQNFARIWANKCSRVITLDVPSALKQDLMRFMPEDDRPARLKEREKEKQKPTPVAPGDELTPEPAPALFDLRHNVWRFIKVAPELPNGGERVGESTCSVTPWPHQARAFSRLYDHWPPKLLIADEVGLGKTIQAGMLLRQAWLAGRAKRILVLAPKAVLNQWQIELREKFNLNWPIFDGQKLTWYPSPAMRGREVQLTNRQSWHKQSTVIASSHLLRRSDRLVECLAAEPWDLIVLDEAHHARRRSAGASKEGGPNALLRLMQGLKERTNGLVLLTATPMQVHPIEVWDLLSLLGLPPEWHAKAFLSFFEDLGQSNPSPEAFERMATLFQATERAYGAVQIEDALQITGLSRLKAGKVMRALRDSATIPRRQLETLERTAAIKLLKATSPTRYLISRHTRELLRRYFKAGKLSTPIADRDVRDEFIDLSGDERLLYASVENYISTTYNNAAEDQRSAVGFVMTIYRRRLASSFLALAKTLQSHLDAISDDQSVGHGLPEPSDEDLPDDDGPDEDMDTDEAASLEQAALMFEEKADIQSLLSRILQLPPDTKLGRLKEVIASFQKDGYRQVMVFTQYTDTMDFLREELRKVPGLTLLCFSGRGGEVPAHDGGWRVISRDDAKRRFREKQADVLLCTDAAAEGLNFQFCGALVNYDMPWNPMRVEQRIGRIDRLGQQYPIIKIVNLHYEGTIETDVYRALRTRINLFTAVVGKLQPILARLPQTIATRVLGGHQQVSDREALLNDVQSDIDQAEQGGFDIDEVTQADLEEPYRPDSPLDMHDLDRVIKYGPALPPGITAEVMAKSQYAYSAPGMPKALRVTTDPAFYEEHAESVELWSPGSPLFPQPEYADELPDSTAVPSIRALIF